MNVTNFQIAAFVFIVAALGMTLSFGARLRISRKVTLAWSLLWVAAAVAIARPGLTLIVAHFLGIARGADLVFYLAILGMFIGFFSVYVRLRRLDAELTRIVRELAVRAPEEPRDGGAGK